MDLDVFYTSLARLINTDTEKARELVTNFNKGSIGFFQSYFDGLVSAKLETADAPDGSVNVTLFVEEDDIGSGAMGVIRKNRAKPFVYKSTRDMYGASKRLIYLKSIFKELIIQTLLQNDAEFGKHICRLSAVYKVSNDCVFQLEPLGINLTQYLGTDDGPKKIVPILIKLLEVIGHFRKTYGFSHNDLRLDNVMTVKEGNTVSNLKLIDFGLSSINIGDVEIGKPSISKADMPYLFNNLKIVLEGRAYSSNNVDEALLASPLFKTAETLSEIPVETSLETYIGSLIGVQESQDLQEAQELKKGGSRRGRRNRRVVRTRKVGLK